MTRLTLRDPRTLTLVMLVAAGSLAGCRDSVPPSDGLGPDTQLPPGLIISDPVSPEVRAAASMPPQLHRRGALTLRADEQLVYVSLPPGTATTGTAAVITVLGTAMSILTSMRDGGFDPVAVAVKAEDIVRVVVNGATGAQVYTASMAVRAARPPRVVRTYPPRRKTDLAVNASIVVVFSEPVHPETTTPSSIQLFRDGVPVEGTVRVLPGSGTLAVFTPRSPLRPRTAYRLRVNTAVTDVGGQPLESSVVTSFSTGSSSVGSPASIALSADSMMMTTLSYPLTATVQDAAGNPLTEQQVQWSTDNPAGLQVSEAGILTGLAAGRYVVTARVNELAATIIVRVVAGAPATLSLAPLPAGVAAADTINLTATVRDAEGRGVDPSSVNWSSSDPGIATVAGSTTSAIVTGVNPGTATITATSGTASGGVTVVVGTRRPVATVTITPPSAALLTTEKIQLVATLRDPDGRALLPRPILWASDNEAVVTVSGTGLVSALATGTVNVRATSEGVTAVATIDVRALEFSSVHIGGSAEHTCALTSNGAAYCWGRNGAGQLGDGSTQGRAVPVAVSGGLAFTDMSTGVGRTCGVTATGAGYCWGAGPVESSASEATSRPVSVAGGHAFAAIVVGGTHACGVATNGAAYCWGNNGNVLGSGSNNPSQMPVAVIGGHQFSALAAGDFHTCGLTTGGTVYCWGENENGQLGNGSTVSSLSPTRAAIPAGVAVIALRAGTRSTCALASNGSIYCWGGGTFGQLGEGSTANRASPVEVAGGHAFSALAVGGYHACGIAAGGRAWCWGQHDTLGNGSPEGSLVPTAVSGDLTYSALSAGRHHTCGLTSSALLYCWGFNSSSQLGNGAFGGRALVPTKVAGQR